PESLGLTIATPVARVVDFGTEFGVEVKSNGDADVLVVSGEVELVREASGQQPERRIRLTKNQGASVAGETRAITRSESVEQNVIASYRRLIDHGMQSGSGVLAPGDMLLFDTFDVAADRDDLNPLPGESSRRQGRLSGVSYSHTDGPTLIQDRQRGGGAMLIGPGQQQVSPDYNFSNADIAAAGGLVIQFDADPVVDGTGSPDSHYWLGLIIGLPDDRRAMSIPQSASPMTTRATGIMLRDNGQFCLFDRGKQVVDDEQWTKQDSTGVHHFRVELDIPAFDGRSPVTIRAFADGSPQPFVEYTTKDGVRDNFIAFEARQRGTYSKLDNLRISLRGRDNSP
ncbi:MAG: hypothetical protein MI757_05565, partial [Pirellulales bacterium]|nr:hypothetical protein [Pirellulales bacterium]